MGEWIASVTAWLVFTAICTLAGVATCGAYPLIWSVSAVFFGLFWSPVALWPYVGKEETRHGRVNG